MGGGAYMKVDHKGEIGIKPGSKMDVDVGVSGSMTTNLDGGVTTTIAGGVDTNLSGGVNTNLSGGLDTNLSGLLQTNNVLKLTGDPSQPLATDSKVEILNLPRFTLDDIKDLTKIRVRIPNYTNVCLKLFGIELMSVSLGGESQIITEPYVATDAEKCNDHCCEPDTRPFPITKKR